MLGELGVLEYNNIQKQTRPEWERTPQFGGFFSQFIVLCEHLTKHWKSKVFGKEKRPPQPKDKAYISSVSM